MNQKNKSQNDLKNSLFVVLALFIILGGSILLLKMENIGAGGITGAELGIEIIIDDVTNSTVISEPLLLDNTTFLNDSNSTLSDNFTSNSTTNLTDATPNSTPTASSPTTSLGSGMTETGGALGNQVELGTQDTASGTSCGNMAATVTLTANVLSTGTCFNISANGITLNCAGFTVKYATTTFGYGVNNTVGYDNVVIKNCVFVAGTTDGGNNHAIYFNNSFGGTITNNSIYTNGTDSNYGVYLDGRTNLTKIQNNTIVTTGKGTYNNVITTTGTTTLGGNVGIYLNESGYNNISSNTINSNGSQGTNGVFIEVRSNYNVFDNNTIKSGGRNSLNYAVYSSGPVTQNNFTNNIIYSNGTSNNYGIYFTTSNNSLIYNNQITTAGSGTDNYGIYLATNSGYNNISSNTINTNGTKENYGIYLQSDSASIFRGNYNLVDNNTIKTYGKSSSSFAYGIYLAGPLTQNNITNNVIITNGTTSSYGIYFVTHVNNSVIYNNQITTTSSGCCNYGIYLQTKSGYNNVSSNTLNTNGTTDNYGIYFTSGTNYNLIDNNTIKTNGPFGLGGDEYGIFVQTNSLQNNLTNNIISTNGTSNNYGIVISGGANNSLIYNNNITTSSDWASSGALDYGIYLTSSCMDSNISSNIINTNGSSNNYGIFLSNNINNSVVYHNQITTNGTRTSNYGIFLQTRSGHNNISNNTIKTNGSQNDFGIYLHTNSDYNILSNLTISSNTATENTSSALILYRSYNNQFSSINFINLATTSSVTAIHILESDQNTFTDMIIDSNYSTELNAHSCLKVDGSITGCRNDFVNTTLNLSEVTNDLYNKIYVQWSVIVNVSNTAGEPLSGVNVSAVDVTNTQDDSNLTGVNGLTTLTLSEYYLEGDVQNYITQNHTITASLNNYSSNQTYLSIINRTTSTMSFVNLTLAQPSCGQSLESNFQFGRNFSCSLSGFTISRNSTQIIGNNYVLAGTGVESGIALQNSQGVNVGNLTITNFSSGIQVSSSNNNVFFNVNVTNSTIGFNFSNSDNNTVYNSNIDNGTSAAVYTTNSWGATNCFVNSTVNFNNISVSGTASICRAWYAIVNVSFNGGLPLAGVTINATFNDSDVLDDTAVTSDNGIATLVLTELVKNASETTTKTPHNISFSFSSLSGTVQNFTVVNISDNVQVNLSTTLSCVVPADELSITNTTVLCPGTFSVNDVDNDGLIKIDNSSLTVSCDETTIIGSAISKGSALYVANKTNITITNCNVQTFRYGARLLFSTKSIINNSYFVGDFYGVEISANGSNNVSFSVFNQSSYGLYLSSGTGNNTIFNNSFDEDTYGIYFPGSSFDITRNLFYFNTFTNTGQRHIFNDDFSVATPNNWNTTLNRSGSVINVGNAYDTICDLSFTDADGDGWYDSGADYPYNYSYDLKVNPDKYNTYEQSADYYPQVFTCPSGVVFLGSSSSSTSGTTDSGSSGGSAAPAAEVAPSAAPSTISDLGITLSQTT